MECVCYEVHKSQQDWKFPSDTLPRRLLGLGGNDFWMVLFHINGQRGVLATVSVQFHRCTSL